MKNKNLKPFLHNLSPKTYHLKPSKGFAMLFSVLVSSLLVVVGFSIFNLALKEITVSTAGRESQIAFYAANSGMECALYWTGLDFDLNKNAFASSTSDIPRATSIPANCNGVKVNGSPNISGGTAITSAVNVPVTDSGGSCFDIKVSKTPNTPQQGQMTTIIESQGHNTCGATGRRVERGLGATIITTM